MPIDPTKTDAERVYDAVQDRFDDVWVELFEVHGKTTLKAEPPAGDDAKADADEIAGFFREKGLRVQCNALDENGEVYEVTATTDAWE